MTLFTGPDGRYRTVTAAGAARYHAQTLERISIYLKENGVPPDAVYPEDVLRAWAADGIGLLSFNQFVAMNNRDPHSASITSEREDFHSYILTFDTTGAMSLEYWRLRLRAFREQRDFADEKATQADALR